MSESGFEMWELVASIIGTAFLLPLLYALLTGGFPSTKIRALDALLTETETLLHTALAEGTIEYSYYKRKIEERIFQAKCRTDELRAEVYNIESCWQELKHWVLGTSNKMNTVIDSLRSIRKDIAVNSTRGRQRLSQMGCTANPTLTKYSVGVATVPSPQDSANVVSRSSYHVPPSSEYTLPSVSVRDRCSCGAIAEEAESKARGVDSEGSGFATLLPPLPFPSSAMTAAKEKRSARRGTLLDLAGKLNHSVDVRTNLGSAYSAPYKNNRYSRLRDKAIGFFRRSSDMTLPRHTGTLPFPNSPPVPALEKGSDYVLRWEKQKHVLVQVHLPA